MSPKCTSALPPKIKQNYFKTVHHRHSWLGVIPWWWWRWSAGREATGGTIVWNTHGPVFSLHKTIYCPIVTGHSLINKKERNVHIECWLLGYYEHTESWANNSWQSVNFARNCCRTELDNAMQQIQQSLPLFFNFWKLQ